VEGFISRSYIGKRDRLFYLEDKENILAGQDIGESISKLVEKADSILVKDF